MKTTLDVTDLLYTTLNTATSLTSEISGTVYKLDRPEQSQKEDIVINALPISTTQPQLCTANVNLYVPDIHASISGVSQYMPNTSRIKAILKILIPLLEVKADGDYLFHVANQTEIRERDFKRTLVNIRVEFMIINS